jgi:hypothetical protein
MKRRDALKIGATILLGRSLQKADATDLLADKWEACGMLQELSGEDKRNCAVLLENQRIYNETLGADDSHTIAAFKRLSIPLIRRMYLDLKEMGISSGLDFKQTMRETLGFKNFNVYPRVSVHALNDEFIHMDYCKEELVEKFKLACSFGGNTFYRLGLVTGRFSHHISIVYN